MSDRHRAWCDLFRAGIGNHATCEGAAWPMVLYVPSAQDKSKSTSRDLCGTPQRSVVSDMLA